jgi:hypothetical protein
MTVLAIYAGYGSFRKGHDSTSLENDVPSACLNPPIERAQIPTYIHDK